MPSQRIAVIGGVAAGPAAAAQAQRVDTEAEVVLFERGPYMSYGACEMPYYVSGNIPDAETLLVLTKGEFEQTRGATVRLNTEILGIHPRRNRLDVRDPDGQVHEERFDKVILAVGARARIPDLEGADAPNVFPLRRLTDAIGLRTYLDEHDVRHVAILGGGYIGVEVAEAMRNRGLRATILDPAPGLLTAYVDEDLRSYVHEAVRSAGVQLRMEEKAVGFELDDRGHVRAVRTDRGELVGCGCVVLAMGVVPNTELAQSAGVRVGTTGALAVDAHMRTNVPNVWACGDCVEVERVIDGAAVHLPLSPVAFRTARVAAENAARRGRGAPSRFPGVCMASGVEVFGLQVAAVGLRLEEARAAGFDAVATTIHHWTRVKIYPGSQRIHVRYVVERGTGRLLGGALVGPEGAALRADVLVPLVREGWRVQDIADLDLLYAPPFAPAHDPLLIAAREAEKAARR